MEGEQGLWDETGLPGDRLADPLLHIRALLAIPGGTWACGLTSVSAFENIADGDCSVILTEPLGGQMQDLAVHRAQHVPGQVRESVGDPELLPGARALWMLSASFSVTGLESPAVSEGLIGGGADTGNVS